MKLLGRRGIETRAPWKPCHLQTIYGKVTAGTLSVSERVWRTAFNIPSSASLTEADVRRVGRLLAGSDRRP